MQVYIATASDADSSDMEWESLLLWCMEVYMTVRLALALLLSALYCFPCYASSALSASPFNALIKGYDIPGLPKSDRYLDYAIVKNTVSFSMNKIMMPIYILSLWGNG